jgi:CheY-like chemotaxis protein
MVPSPTKPALTQKTVLVVDDFPSVRYYHEQILKKAGYRCISARDGQDALNKLHQSKIDLVVLDVLMPNLTGVEFIRQIHGTAAFAKLPILLISIVRIADIAEQEKLADHGPIGFVRKPASPATILAELDRLVAGE